MRRMCRYRRHCGLTNAGAADGNVGQQRVHSRLIVILGCVAGAGARNERSPGASFAGSVQPRPPHHRNTEIHEHTRQQISRWSELGFPDKGLQFLNSRCVSVISLRTHRR